MIMKKLFVKSPFENRSKSVYSLLTLIAFLLISNFVSAQDDRFSLTIRPAGNFPTKELANTNLKTGFGFEGTVAYKFLPHLGAYAGWGWNHFAADNSFAGTDMDFEETGYSLGLQFIHPVENSKLNYLIGAGAIYNHIEIENNQGDIVADSKHGWGWRAEAGIDVPVAKQLHLTPTIRYQTLSRDFAIGETKTAGDLNYVSVGVGLSWYF